MGPSSASPSSSASPRLSLHPPRRRRQQRLGAAAALLAVAGAAVLVLQGDEVPSRTSPSRLLGNKRKLTNLSLKGSALAAHQHDEEHGSASPPPVPSYTTTSIINLQRQLQRACLLLFDGQSGKFHVYTPLPTMRGRYVLPATLMINALRRYFPQRLERGRPNLQILFSADDCIELRCLEYNADGSGNIDVGTSDGNNRDAEDGGRYGHLFTDECQRVEDETGGDFAPVLAFDSVPVHHRELFGGDVVRPMPLPQWLGCFRSRYFGDGSSNHVDGDGSVGNGNGSDGEDDICHLLPHLSDEVLQRGWEDLPPQIFWRGSDFPSSTYAGVPHSGRASDADVVDLGEREGVHAPADAVDVLRRRWEVLSPRWRAVALSLEARIESEIESEGDDEKNNYDNDEEPQEAAALPWIDARFKVRPERTPFYEPHYFGASTEEHTGPSAQAGHRYYVDLGGGGGTTWQGTLNMLYFPGLLFHHETLTKDFFHDEMKPYEHYVPVKMDLSDLREKFDWAEEHPEEAQRIAKAATDLAIKLASASYVQELFDNLFLATLGKMVESYQPEEGETIESILQKYEEAGVPFHDMGECNVGECNWNFGGGISKLFVGDGGGGGASAVA